MDRIIYWQGARNNLARVNPSAHHESLLGLCPAVDPVYWMSSQTRAGVECPECLDIMRQMDEAREQRRAALPRLLADIEARMAGAPAGPDGVSLEELREVADEWTEILSGELFELPPIEDEQIA